MACQTVYIMVSWKHTHQTFTGCLFTVFFIGFYEIIDISFCTGWKIRLFAAEQIVGMWGTKLQQKVHVESSLQRSLWITPFRYHCCIRKFFIKEFSDLFPYADGSFFLRIIFHQRLCHIYPEAITAHTQPESHYIFHCCDSCLWSFIVDRLLPRFLRIRLIETIV